MTDKPYPGGIHLDFRNNKTVKTSGTGGGTHTVLGEPERTTTNFPNSTELINMAHREWKNRQKRKGHDDAVPWTSGWISGYLTGKGTLSAELESAYKNGFNDGQAEGLSDESKAHKDFAKNYFATLLDCDCQVCIDAREAHDTAIRKAEREWVLDNLREWFIKNKCNGCPYGRNLLDKIKSLRGDP